ncbi:MAG: MltA domain-containing protein [Desulfatibacillaceae bacterium]|nr:MltA domain-containing protein [Desulfatibacillaceae bacterium]
MNKKQRFTVIAVLGSATLLAALIIWRLSVPVAPVILPPEKPPALPPAGIEYPMGRVESDNIPLFSDDMDMASLVTAMNQSRAYFSRLPKDRQFAFGKDSFTTAHMQKTLDVFQAFLETGPDIDELNAFVRENFAVYQSQGSDQWGAMLFTGYYEPVIRGSLTPDPKYPYPLYSVPNDLISIDLGKFSSKFAGERITARIEGNAVLPYFDRKDIEEKNVLKGRANVVAWLECPIDRFFLHIQGSGRVELSDGTLINVGYAGSSGRPYQAVGGILIRDGHISREEMSMQAIRQWAQENPHARQELFNANPSYVFFTKRDSGPLGCYGVPVTPGRSVATDRAIFPGGALAWIASQKPAIDPETGGISLWQPFGRFVLNQDTGGAIKTPGRLDLFWGHGPYAEIAAGHMKHEGRLYFLILKDDFNPQT